MTSGRLQAWIRQHFEPDEVEPVLSLLADVVPVGPESTAEGDERVQAAVVLLSAGDVQQFLQALTIAQDDWRDVLVWAQLADEDWADRLDTALG